MHKKEYPATHSMWTSWFAADKDGNVAIMECFDEGPSPLGYNDEMSVEELLDTEGQIQYTPSQRKLVEESGIEDHWDTTYNFFGDEIDKPDPRPLPFYFYYQGDYGYGNTERLQTPYNDDCVKIDQLSPALKKKTLCLPFSFSNTEAFPLAEFTPCQYWNYPEIYVDGRQCVPARFSDGKTYLISAKSGDLKVELDEAFSNHKVEWKNKYCKEYRVNGKRGYLKYGDGQENDIYVRWGDNPWGNDSLSLYDDGSNVIEEVENQDD